MERTRKPVPWNENMKKRKKKDPPSPVCKKGTRRSSGGGSWWGELNEEKGRLGQCEKAGRLAGAQTAVYSSV